MNLELLKFSDEYIKFIEKWESTNELSKYLSHTRPRYLRESDSDAEKNTLFFLIKFNTQIIGATWLEGINDKYTKIGIYIADTHYRGRGIGREVLKNLIHIAFYEMNLQEIHLNVREKNLNAIKCYEKCGFKIIKIYPKLHFPDGSYQAAYQMTLLNDNVLKGC